MTRRDALIALRDAVREGKRVNQWDGSLQSLFGANWLHAYDAIEWSSMDGAEIFMRKTLPLSDGWHWSISVSRSGPGATVWHEPDKCTAVYHGKGRSPARALLLAILEALIAKERSDDADQPARDREKGEE